MQNTVFPIRNVSRLIIFSALVFSAFLSIGSAPITDSYWKRKLLRDGEMNLPVDTLLQSKPTSCGPASIVMAYNYAYPEAQITEQEVIQYASLEGLYTEKKHPFTSPENMVKIAKHYADTVSVGTVNNADEGLTLLIEKLTGGDPVIIDIFARLDDPKSGAHFVVATGIAMDPKNPSKTKIYFNDPLTGTNRSAYWLGDEGIWNAWKNNGDPGGSGWWMMIPSP